jgi:hypothetical protein
VLSAQTSLHSFWEVRFDLAQVEQTAIATLVGLIVIKPIERA